MSSNRVDGKMFRIAVPYPFVDRRCPYVLMLEKHYLKIMTDSYFSELKSTPTLSSLNFFYMESEFLEI